MEESTLKRANYLMMMQSECDALVWYCSELNNPSPKVEENVMKTLRLLCEDGGFHEALNKFLYDQQQHFMDEFKAL